MYSGQAPVDAALDIAKLDLSPAVRRMLALVGSELPFQQGRQQMEVLAGLSVTAKAVERTAEAIGSDIAQGEQQEIQRALQLDLPVVVGQPIPILYVQMDGTGVPVVKKETADRQGKANEQPAHTREVKLGWKQSRHRRRRPMDLEPCRPAFFRRAADLYHARQHLWELARQLHPNHQGKQKAWMKVHQKRLLDHGKIEKLVLSLRSIHSPHSEVIDKVRIEADYFEKNAARRRYPMFRSQHLFVGFCWLGRYRSGVQNRSRFSPQTVRHVLDCPRSQRYIALRCCQLNHRFEDYWEARRAA